MVRFILNFMILKSKKMVKIMNNVNCVKTDVKLIILVDNWMSSTVFLNADIEPKPSTSRSNYNLRPKVKGKKLKISAKPLENNDNTGNEELKSINENECFGNETEGKLLSSNLKRNK